MPGRGHLHVKADGQADGLALVLLNMALTNLSSWEPFMAAMPEGFRYIRHDYRGTGQSISDETEGMPNLDVFARDTLSVLDDLEIDSAILVGSSFGARVALKAALLMPRRVAALCLFDASIRQPPRSAELERTLSLARAARRSAGIAEQPTLPKWFRHRNLELGRRVFLTARDESQMDASELCGISAPTIVLTGEFDSNLSASREIVGQIEGAQLVTIPASSHGTIIQRPNEAAHQLVRFLLSDRCAPIWPR